MNSDNKLNKLRLLAKFVGRRHIIGRLGLNPLFGWLCFAGLIRLPPPPSAFAAKLYLSRGSEQPQVGQRRQVFSFSQANFLINNSIGSVTSASVRLISPDSIKLSRKRSRKLLKLIPNRLLLDTPPNNNQTPISTQT